MTGVGLISTYIIYTIGELAAILSSIEKSLDGVSSRLPPLSTDFDVPVHPNGLVRHAFITQHSGFYSPHASPVLLIGG